MKKKCVLRIFKNLVLFKFSVEPTKPLASCDVFDPFKVLPTEPDHFQIGGAFSLHREDCLELNPFSVQEVVAVQWAMGREGGIL